MNKWVILGNLGHDPKRGTSQSGTALCFMDVAVSKNGGRDTDWVSVTAFGKTAENCLQYLRKGNEIVAGGAASVRTWQRNDGSNAAGLCMAADFVEFGRGGREQSQSAQAAQESKPAQAAEQIQSAQAVEIDPDDLPF